MHGQLAGHVRGTGAVGHMGWTEGLVALWQDRIILYPACPKNIVIYTLGLHFASCDKENVANTGSYRVNSRFVNVRR